jgi:hypothetical protein
MRKTVSIQQEITPVSRVECGVFPTFGGEKEVSQLTPKCDLKG